MEERPAGALIIKAWPAYRWTPKWTRHKRVQKDHIPRQTPSPHRQPRMHAVDFGDTPRVSPAARVQRYLESKSIRLKVVQPRGCSRPLQRGVA